MRYPQLDDRLQAAADLFPVCAYGADIGADHGRLSCHLLHSGKCARMIVSDISAESLAKAQALLALHELADRADFCVADGLNALRGRPNVQCAVMCGMGGRLISQILHGGCGLLQGAALVLSSHTDIPLVRQTLMQIGYAITAERIVRAKGRFYVLMRAEPGNAHYILALRCWIIRHPCGRIICAGAKAWSPAKPGMNDSLHGSERNWQNENRIRSRRIRLAESDCSL